MDTIEKGENKANVVGPEYPWADANKEIIVASKFIDKVKELDEQFRENRTNIGDFKTECDLGDYYGNFNIKQIKLDLLSQKERLPDKKIIKRRQENQTSAMQQKITNMSNYMKMKLFAWIISCTRILEN